MTISIEDFLTAYNDIESSKTIGEVSKKLGLSTSQVRRRAQAAKKSGLVLVDRSKLNNPAYQESPPEVDPEVQVENFKLAKKLQRSQDKNRIEAKVWRTQVRNENVLEELYENILEKLDSWKPSPPSSQVKSHGNTKYEGLVHLSDLHLNSQINLPWNTYNFDVAGKRLKKYTDLVKQTAEGFGIEKLWICSTGDLLSSSRRLDELVTNAGNLTSSCLKAVDLIGEVIRNLSQDYEISVAHVCGNESRLQEHVGWNPKSASENFDELIFGMLERLYACDTIKFVEGDSSELVIDVCGHKVLLLHGHGAGIGNTPRQKDIQAIMGRYSSHGVDLEGMFFGHIHEAIISDLFGRSSSLMGADNYAGKGLGLAGRSSQNFYIYQRGKSGFHGMKFDLVE